MDNFRNIRQDLVRSLHLSMGETCDHVAEMFLVEPAVCTGLTNPSCSSFANEWLPCRKYIELTKIKDLNFDRENLA